MTSLLLFCLATGMIGFTVILKEKFPQFTDLVGFYLINHEGSSLENINTREFQRVVQGEGVL